MIKLRPFTPSDFDQLIAWVDSPALLLTIAGNDLTYPVTHEQLNRYARDKESHAFVIVDAVEGLPVGHAELRHLGDSLYKIDKLLIGEAKRRGNGMGQQVIHELLQYGFHQLHAACVELNVFEWNTGAIRCYEKCGFTVTPAKTKKFQTGTDEWTAINMTVDRSRWVH